MCFGRTPSTPPPPTLATPPPPPAPPAPPAPEPENLVSEVNPQIRRAQSQKAKNQAAQGTGQLRIKLDPKLNTPTAGPASGVNTGNP